jgi:hypothetical protein
LIVFWSSSLSRSSFDSKDGIEQRLALQC